MRENRAARLLIAAVSCLCGLSCEEEKAPFVDLSFGRDSGTRSSHGDGGTDGASDSGEPDLRDAGEAGVTYGPDTQVSPDQDFDPARVYLVADLASAKGLHTVIVDALDMVRVRAVGPRPAAWITEKGELLHAEPTLDLDRKVTRFVCDAPCSVLLGEAHTLSADPASNDFPLGTLSCGTLIVSPDSELFETCGDVFREQGDEVLLSDGVSWIAVGPGRIALVKRLAPEYAENPVALMDLKSGAFTEISGANLPLDLIPQRVRRLDDGFWALGGPLDDGGEATRYRIALDGFTTIEGTFFPLPDVSTIFANGVGILGADGLMYRIIPYLTDSQGSTHQEHALLRTELNKVPNGANVLLDTDFSETKLSAPLALVTGS